MDLFEKFLNVIDRLQKENVDYILIGGFAVVLHGFPRLTQDIDLFIRPTEENISKLKMALHSVFEDPDIDGLTLQELQKYPVIRYGTPEGFSIDLIISLGETFIFDDIEYDLREIDGYTVRIATPKALFNMKKSTFREIDQMDLQFLRLKIDEG